MSIDQLTQFFGWCTIINMGVIMVTSILLVFFRQPIARIHHRLMDVPESGRAV